MKPLRTSLLLLVSTTTLFHLADSSVVSNTQACTNGNCASAGSGGGSDEWPEWMRNGGSPPGIPDKRAAYDVRIESSNAASSNGNNANYNSRRPGFQIESNSGANANSVGQGAGIQIESNSGANANSVGQGASNCAGNGCNTANSVIAGGLGPVPPPAPSMGGHPCFPFPGPCPDIMERHQKAKEARENRKNNRNNNYVGRGPGFQIESSNGANGANFGNRGPYVPDWVNNNNNGNSGNQIVSSNNAQSNGVGASNTQASSHSSSNRVSSGRGPIIESTNVGSINGNRAESSYASRGPNGDYRLLPEWLRTRGARSAGNGVYVHSQTGTNTNGHRQDANYQTGEGNGGSNLGKDCFPFCGQ